jgi:hypothetical protein
MKKFIFKFAFITFIFLFIQVIINVFWDPFYVFRSYDEYYYDNRVSLNREQVCLNLMKKKLLKKDTIGNLIIGNSRSNAFRTSMWSSVIGVDNNKCFHYDGSGFGLWRTTNILTYLCQKQVQFENILLVMDVEFFDEVSNNKGYLYSQPPEISKENLFEYYFAFVKAASNPVFQFSVLIKSITKKHFSFMKYYVSPSKYLHTSNNKTGDLYYGLDKEILEDSNMYYGRLLKNSVFYNRPKREKISPVRIGPKQIYLLNKIRNCITQNRAKVKIVVAPLYNQEKLNKEDLKTLTNLFGVNNIDDFSGINEITSDYRNYYESSHFKPYVASKIMHLIYKQ